MDEKPETVIHRERTTITNSSGPSMGIIVGILVVVVAAIAYFLFSGQVAEQGTGASDVSISIGDSGSSAVEGAADAVEDAATAVEGAVSE